MWKTPIYKLKQPVLNGVDDAYREIVIDVTRSAPPFSEPGKTLAAALEAAIRESGLRKTDRVLDFGAGKLRNTLFLLERGYQVCAVEYKKLFAGRQAASALSQARTRRKRFSTLVYPHQFIHAKAKFDFVALINVLNIMPVPIERLKVLLYCHQRLNPNGHVFWYTQRGDASYEDKLVPEYQIGDGYFLGQNAYHKTFYREWTVAEIDKMLADTGFELVCPISASSRNQCRLYRRKASAPLARQLRDINLGTESITDDRIPDPKAVEPRVVTGRPRTRKGDPDPQRLQRQALYTEKLRSIPTGPHAAKEYQQHVCAVLELLFSPAELRKFRLEQNVFGDIKRLDILAYNKARRGFFYSLKADHGFKCPTIVIECKNYDHSVENPEFDQLGSRLGKKLGYCGILAFRSAANADKVFERCRVFFNNEDKIIIPLSDLDLIELLRLHQKRDLKGVEDYLDDLLFRIKAG